MNQNRYFQSGGGSNQKHLFQRGLDIILWNAPWGLNSQLTLSLSRVTKLILLVQGRPLESERVKKLSPLTLSLPRVTKQILLCLMPDDFTRPRETLGSERVKKLKEACLIEKEQSLFRSLFDLLLSGLKTILNLMVWMLLTSGFIAQNNFLQ